MNSTTDPTHQNYTVTSTNIWWVREQLAKHGSPKSNVERAYVSKLTHRLRQLGGQL